MESLFKQPVTRIIASFPSSTPSLRKSSVCPVLHQRSSGESEWLPRHSPTRGLPRVSLAETLKQSPTEAQPAHFSFKSALVHCKVHILSACGKQAFYSKMGQCHLS
ncbi:hypothetical protein GN956_G5270 [Arapaima gigas]